ncbi:hypothetical protein E2C01_020835 [Portunus trituberculatus]|uniref:Uncharacterized protein n=1 Tax=Portunus trituberculatus TaxID=210409 RepID=A0A5B7E1M4_PORTR|nr:hypothetical protein [Portunus trituberculatus]
MVITEMKQLTGLRRVLPESFKYFSTSLQPFPASSRSSFSGCLLITRSHVLQSSFSNSHFTISSEPALTA